MAQCNTQVQQRVVHKRLLAHPALLLSALCHALEQIPRPHPKAAEDLLRSRCEAVHPGVHVSLVLLVLDLIARRGSRAVRSRRRVHVGLCCGVGDGDVDDLQACLVRDEDVAPALRPLWQLHRLRVRARAQHAQARLTAQSSKVLCMDRNAIGLQSSPINRARLILADQSGRLDLTESHKILYAKRVTL